MEGMEPTVPNTSGAQQTWKPFLGPDEMGLIVGREKEPQYTGINIPNSTIQKITYKTRFKIINSREITKLVVRTDEKAKQDTKYW